MPSSNPEVMRKASRKFFNKKRDMLHKAKDKPCESCGIKYPPYVMDLHHVEDKTKSINKIWASGSISALESEIKKCIVLCANCHRIHHHAC